MRPRLWIAAVASLLVALALGFAILERPVPTENLPARTASAIGDAGVAHPVTAVLLEFRSFDTLLEIAVLLVAVVVALALREAQPDGADRMGLDNPLLHAVIGLLLPLMLLVTAYLLWAGSTRPGGAFQAGAVLAACGVLLRLSGTTLHGLEHGASLRIGLAAGLLVFVAVGAAPMIGGGLFLDYPDAYAGGLILFIEVALTLSIGLALLSLFRLAPPQSDSPHFDDRRLGKRE
ncbi:Na(+)/H(+) antiporter subunit B [Rhodocyclaceae bacterium SMB388]